MTATGGETAQGGGGRGGKRRAAAIIEQAEALADGASEHVRLGFSGSAFAQEFAGGPEPEASAPFSGPDYRHEDHHDDDVDPGDGPSDEAGGDVDIEVVAACARLDHSDTDNAERLRRHFGADMAVLAQDGISGGDWLAWSGSHWDLAGGAARVRLIAQQLGGRIAREAAFIQPTPEERRAIEAAEGAEPDSVERRDAEKAKAAVARRRAARRAFAVTSKNSGRMEKALECLAPHIRRQPEEFNPDRFAFATAGHTLRLVREPDPDCPDPDATRWRVRLDEREGHDRADWLTSVLPMRWAGLDAPRPRWDEFLERMLPDPAKRRTVQQFAGTSLLAVSPQFVMFHYGSGANGKSAFLETLTRVLGPGFGVGLPRESLVGGSERGSGSAAPDLARLFGKRMVRILEVKGDVPLQEDLIKRLTGGEAFPVRSLFKGYFEFQSVATAHMSGNGLPTIDGTDNGIWRRMLLVHWDQTIPEDERLDFDEVVSGFVRDEGPGILAWLVEGALSYRLDGLSIADSVRASTSEYRDEMDPIGEFRKACVREATGQRVQSRDMYEAYRSWSMANAKRVRTETKFGRTMKQVLETQEIGGRIYYLNCVLHEVPERPNTSGDPGPKPDW